jgi:anaerobic ribonucleoside-triphosphate reductase
MNYNFNDVEKYLRDGGDPTKMAQAFADVMNKALAKVQEESKLGQKANEFANAWNAYVDEYFKTHDVPNNYVVADMYLNDRDVTYIMEQVLKFIPLLDKLGGWFEFEAKQMSKSKDKVEDTVDKFFNKFGI